MDDTTGSAYTDRLRAMSGARWKRVLNVQAPYRWHLRHLHLGRTVDVGCGIGRNLANLPAGSVGVDHNEHSVRVARSAGLNAMTVDEWQASPLAQSGSFDSLLFAHVVEHMTHNEALDLITSYLPALAPDGRAHFVCPQERGYASDSTHVSWTTGDDLAQLAREAGLTPEPPTSFPFPRVFGRVFTYNEFHLTAANS